eukprot:scaffold113164_cov36-Prasinocladus_malaysianus.AAC.1
MLTSADIAMVTCGLQHIESTDATLTAMLLLAIILSNSLQQQRIQDITHAEDLEAAREAKVQADG